MHRNVQYSTRLGGCYGQVVRDVDAPVGFRVFDKPTSESRGLRDGRKFGWLRFFNLRFRVLRV